MQLSTPPLLGHLRHETPKALPCTQRLNIRLENWLQRLDHPAATLLSTPYFKQQFKLKLVPLVFRYQDWLDCRLWQDMVADCLEEQFRVPQTSLQQLLGQMIQDFRHHHPLQIEHYLIDVRKDEELALYLLSSLFHPQNSSNLLTDFGPSKRWLSGLHRSNPKQTDTPQGSPGMLLPEVFAKAYETLENEQKQQPTQWELRLLSYRLIKPGATLARYLKAGGLTDVFSALLHLWGIRDLKDKDLDRLLLASTQDWNRSWNMSPSDSTPCSTENDQRSLLRSLKELLSTAELIVPLTKSRSGSVSTWGPSPTSFHLTRHTHASMLEEGSAPKTLDDIMDMHPSLQAKATWQWLAGCMHSSPESIFRAFSRLTSPPHQETVALIAPRLISIDRDKALELLCTWLQGHIGHSLQKTIIQIFARHLTPEEYLKVWERLQPNAQQAAFSEFAFSYLLQYDS